MPEIPSYLVVPLVLLSSIAVMNILRSPKPEVAIKEFGGGILILAVFVVIVATILRLGWKAFQFAWS
jgi:membrane protein YdbS with pleckstrin-like domain